MNTLTQNNSSEKCCGKCTEKSSHDGYLLFSGSRDGSIRVWDLRTKICISTLRRHTGEVLSLRLSCCGDYLFSSSSTGEVFVWDVSSTIQLVGVLSINHALNNVPIALSNVCSTSTSNLVNDVPPHHMSQRSGSGWWQNTPSSPSFKENTNWSFTASNNLNPSMRNGPFSIVTALANTRLLSVPTMEVFKTVMNNTTSMPVNSVGGTASNIHPQSNEGGVHFDSPCYPPSSSMTNTTITTLTAFVCCGDGIIRLLSFKPPASSTTQHVNASMNAGNISVDQIEKIATIPPDPSTLPQIFCPLDLERTLQRFVSIPTVSSQADCASHMWSGAKFLANLLESIGAESKIARTTASTSLSHDCSSLNHQHSNNSSSSSSCINLPPVVFGRLGANPEKPTVVFYGHYDVVPAGSIPTNLVNPILHPTTGHSNPNVNLGGASSSISPLLNTSTSTAAGLGPWRSDPWLLSSVDGYLYGRGVSDNKGPIVASIFAAKSFSLMQEEIPVNIVWILEGAEEIGSPGFEPTVTKYKNLGWFQNTVAVVACNSYWTTDHQPCVVYGMRGVLDIQVEVVGGCDDVHAGVHGGAIVEPLHDVLAVGANLVDASGFVCAPGFYDDVRSMAEEEQLRLAIAADAIGSLAQYSSDVGGAQLRSSRPAELLSKRWCEPCLTVSEVWTSSQRSGGFRVGETFRVISGTAGLNISIRFVADQSATKLFELVSKHMHHEFRKRRSPNKLIVKKISDGQAWLGDLSASLYRKAVSAVAEAWETLPLLTREGGSMPVVSFLENILNVPAVQIPIGQASDAAHLPNERLRLLNLQKGVIMLRKLFQKLGSTKDAADKK
eukprot:GDKJ01015800.1.p1 GENE.GDKJ01015800.1~~GDKJ01015800.1.p1  ORF type:complete len:957 (+),score=222.95 GDKJ01015800.1:365-2872(+)